jgi:hypothetical protein
MQISHFAGYAKYVCLAGLLLITTNASACGWPAAWAELILNTSEPEQAPFGELLSCSSAYTPEDDSLILRAVVHGLEIGVDDDLIRSTLATYNCLATASDDEDYVKIIEFIGKKKFESFCADEMNTEGVEG